MAKDVFRGPLEQLDECCWRIPRSYRPGMRVDGLVFADDHLMKQIQQDQALDQVANVAFLPGIQHASLAMPDIHWGYGFCIGGVCATDPNEGGVISPGGVGYDINCGVRLVKSNLFYREVKHPLRTLVEELFRQVPTGAGKSGRYHFNAKELKQLMTEGTRFLAGRGLATAGDVAHTEAEGRLDGAEPDSLSARALERGEDQCGTLGSGNHFLEVQIVDHIFDEEAAAVMGLEKDMVCVMIHSGSRGLGYQVCDDALGMLRKAPEKYGIDLPDRQLACAPVNSSEGRHYIGAMRAAANFAWCNRQLLMHQAREVFARVFGRS
jgi:tRNA-splicing ligase RtcB (3'-phosphate/5'-hydroxy nucleic acid ligase)